MTDHLASSNLPPLIDMMLEPTSLSFLECRGIRWRLCHGCGLGNNRLESEAVRFVASVLQFFECPVASSNDVH